MRKALLLLWVLAIPMQAQNVQRWDIPGNPARVQLHAMGEDAIGIEARIDVYPDWWTEIRASLHAYIPEGGTTAAHYQLWPRENYYQWTTEGTWPGFSWDVTRTPDGEILVAVALMDLFETDVGMRVDSVRDLRLLRIGSGRTEQFAQLPGALRPCFFSSANGDTWLSWEHVVERNTLDSSGINFDMVEDYSAEIRAVRITSDLTLDSTIVLGTGHTPRWVESSSGELYLLRRRIDFSTEERVNDIILTRVTPSIGPDVILDSIAYLSSVQYHGYLPETVAGFQILAGDADDFHMLYQSDSLHYLHVADDGTVRRQVRPRISGKSFFRRGTDGVPMLFWTGDTSGITWSDASGAGLFSTITPVPGTADAPWLGEGWSAQWWKEGHVKLLHRVAGDSRSLAVMHRAESPSPREAHLFTLPEDLQGSITAWSLSQEGVLWLMHRELTQDSTLLHDMLRVTDLPLDVRSVRELPPHPVITGLYPHPVRSDAVLRVELPVGGTMLLTVTDLTGRMVARLPATEVQPGIQDISLDLPQLTPGSYLLSGSIGSHAIRRLLIMR